ncbi:P-loop containing nucleoside triphosphate hydrolase protein [Lentinula aff. lateritia]|uniref:P-loop containing nucleoside triphosphate hydrolase protein n=1 Tax=Lentinula aff. lateritia TaxID=2804960 RepID=A0ACC1UH01_9AGAR|nr:P-loop containing nucleoside triphosphate hydrolase protein [Lentinula aff. lateritia]
MKPFLSTSIFRERCWTRLSALQKIRLISKAAENYQHASPSKPVLSFEDAGLRPPLAQAVYTAFPNVKSPTEIQSTLISSVLEGKDIILQDETGSGKSFGLILALLNKPRMIFTDDPSADRASDRPAITSLVLVPHRDLAFQMMHWIDLIAQASSDSPPSLASIAQVLVREGRRHITEGLPLIRNEPPHVLIATPASVVEVLREDPNAFRLTELSTVVLDEVDYMIETLPLNNNPRKQHIQKMNKLQMHPGPARALLDGIYEARVKLNAKTRQALGDAPYHSPQLILSSATIRRQLKHYFFSEKQLLNRDVVKIRRSVMRLHGQDELATGEHAIHSVISHHVVVASENGIVNIPSAVSAEEKHTHHRSIGTELYRISVLFAIDGSIFTEFAMTPSQLNQNLLEAVAAVFALDVPSVALLVIPPNASVHRAVYDLREIGVNAHGMDVLVQDRGRSYLLQAGGEKKADPKLLVCTTSSIRGIDFPSLTHVFILGFNALIAKDNWTLTLDTYIHLCGRVGRFKKPGKVITVVDEKDVSGIDKVLHTLDVTPVRLNLPA